MPKGGLSYKSYTACVRDAKANGVSVKNSGMPNSSGNNMPQPRPGRIKGYGGNQSIGPQTDPRLAAGNQVMSGGGPAMRSKTGPGIPIGPGGGIKRNPMQNQAMSGQGPAGVRPGNVVAPPAPGQPRPLSKRRRPQPNPVPRPRNRNTY